MHQVVAYKTLKTMEKSLTVRLQKGSWSLTGGGRFLEVPTAML